MFSATDPTVWSPVAIGIQLLGILAASIARASRGSRGQASAGALFVVTLVAVAVSTMVSKLVGDAGGLVTGGGCLGVMVMMTLWERPRTAFDEIV